MIIRFTEEQIRLLVEKTGNSYPIESCGLLFGDIVGEESMVRKIIATRNILESPTIFQIDEEEFLKALFESEKEGLQHIGFFHSHPAVPQPSVTDIRFMRFWPEHVWVIISSVDFGIEAYQVINDEIRRVDVEIKNYVNLIPE